MDQPKRAYSIFCDESCYLQFDNSDIMCIGAIIVPYADLEVYKLELKRIKRKYGILNELKWNTVSRTHLAMYDEIMQLFFNSTMVFRSVLVKNKSNIRVQALERNEYNRFYCSVVARPKKNRIYGNAANQVSRSSIDDVTKSVNIINPTKSEQRINYKSSDVIVYSTLAIPGTRLRRSMMPDFVFKLSTVF